MKPFVAKRRRSGTAAPVRPYLRRSPAKRSPFKRRSGMAGASSLAATAVDAAGESCNIKVAVRVRPENDKEEAGCFRNIIDIVDDQMLVFDPKEDADDFFFHGRKQERRDLNKKVQRDQKFAFDRVFGPNSTNEDVFEGTTKDLIDVLFNGFNCSVFVYGATGSGKTHTMLGKENNPGITLRTVVELYDRIAQLDEDISCEVMVSYLEIYNENVFDLINPGTQLQVREDGKAGVNIPGLSRHKPSGPDELLQLLQFGNGNRTQHPTDANKESSRSHAVFQVYIKQKSKSSGLSADVKVSKLSMIDLAGSERGSVTSSRGPDRFREGANINKSLLALGNCINALADGSKYIPYRNSKLTRLLKDSIGGNCRTVMISNISPSSMTYEDTHNTLKYADRAKKIKIKLKKNVVSVDFHIAQYAKIVESLKAEILQHKEKIVALEEENESLKSRDFPRPPEGETISANNSADLENLRRELASLQERQKDYDELQQRIASFERQQKNQSQNISGSRPTTPDALLSPEVELQVENHKELLRKNFKAKSDYYALELSKHYHERKLKRCSTVILSESLCESGFAKLKRFIANLETKQAKIKRKNLQVSQNYNANKVRICEFGSNVLNEISRMQLDLRVDHLKRLLEVMFNEQERTEDLLTRSLQQLKKTHLLFLSYGHVSTDLTRDFEDLFSCIQFTKVQYRDSKLVETNEDTTSDKIGVFLAGIVDLESGFGEKDEQRTLDQTVVIDKNVIEAEVLQDGTATMDEISDDEVFEDDLNEQENSKAWKPPTPPRAFSSTNDCPTPPSPKLSTVNFEKRSDVYSCSPLAPLVDGLSPIKYLAKQDPESELGNESKPIPTKYFSESTFICPSKVTPDSTFSIAEPDSAETSYALDQRDKDIITNTSNLQSSSLDTTITLPQTSQAFNSTISLESTNSGASVDYRRPILMQQRFDEKENITYKASAPVAKVSPMTTSNDLETKIRRTLKKTYHHPIASTSNLGLLLSSVKPRSREPLGLSRVAHGSANSVSNNTPSYMQSTAASKFKNRSMSSSASAQSQPQRQRSRSPIGRAPTTKIPKS